MHVYIYIVVKNPPLLFLPASGKEPACQCRRHKNACLIPVSGRSPGERQGSPLQYYCLENPMDRGAWQATVHRVA